MAIQKKSLQQNQIDIELLALMFAWKDIPNNPPGQYEYMRFLYEYQHQFETCNLGDYIQTIAMENALAHCGRKISTKVDRDELAYYRGEVRNCVMQVWFSECCTLLPPPSVNAVYFGTHFSNTGKMILKSALRLNPEWRHTLEIGCRDLSTVRFCQQQGIKSYFSRCLTLTLPKREVKDTQTKIFLTDLPNEVRSCLPDEIKRGAISVSQKGVQFISGASSSFDYVARALLDTYRDEARLIITSAIHCAMPALAMGIPVVFIASSSVANETTLDERFSVLRGLLPIYSIDDVKNQKVNYTSKPVDIEP